MTDAFEHDAQDEQQQDEQDVIEPEQGDPPVADPVTARNTDPAAMSEHERNQRLSETYDSQRQLPL